MQKMQANRWCDDMYEVMTETNEKNDNPKNWMNLILKSINFYLKRIVE